MTVHRSALAARWLSVGILGAVALSSILMVIATSRMAPRTVHLDFTETRSIDALDQTSREGTSLRVAVATMLNPTTNVGAYGSLLETVGRQLGRRVELVQRASYGEVNALIDEGEVDLAFVCSGAFIHLKRSGSAKLFLVPVIHGDAVYRSLIIVGAGSSARSFEDLRGRTFAYVDPLSNTGYYYPRWRASKMSDNGDPFFGTTTFTNGHERSLEMVLNGVVDAAAIDDLVFTPLAAQRAEVRDRVRVLERSRVFPIPPLVARRGLPGDLERRLREIFLNLHQHERGRAALEALGVERFVEGDEDEYDVIEEIMEGTTRRTP